MSENINKPNSNLKINTYSADTGAVSSGKVGNIEIEVNVREKIQKDEDKKKKRLSSRATKEVITLVVLIPLTLYVSLFISVFMFLSVAILFYGAFILTLFDYNPFIQVRRKSILTAVAVWGAVLVAYSFLR